MLTGKEIKRVAISGIMLIVFWFLFVFMDFNNQGAQLWMYKIILANSGFLNAHIVRKLAFPRVENWDDIKQPYLKGLIVALYAVFVYCFASGG